MPNIKIGSKTFTDVEKIKVPLADGTGQASFGSGDSAEKYIEWHQCPEAVRKFVSEVTYDPNDYSVSRIAEYAPANPVVSNYKPIGKIVGDKTFYNEIPGVNTIFYTDDMYGTVKPLDHVRYINTPVALNVRDLGGWACDGGTVKYGMLYRGGYLSPADRNVLVGECGVRHDLDLRGATENYITSSPLGSDVHFTRPPNYNWYSLSNKDIWRQNIRCVFDAVLHNEPLYFHCAAGADRTGTLACVLEGLLGMSQSDIDKDYELTCFYSGAGTNDQARRRNESEWIGLINAINAYVGDSFRDKCIAFVAELGFTADEINAYRKAMIDGNPEEITLSVGTCAITNDLTNASNGNITGSAAKYQPYEANITVPYGYAINDVKVTMGGVNITAQVFSGTKVLPTNKIVKNVTNCTVDCKNAVVSGQGFVATITANEGYSLNGASIKILMGGVDVSTYYKDGKIAIPNVTGDIEITIKAVEYANAYTNQIAISKDADGSIFNGAGYMINKRLKSSGAVSDLEYTGQGRNPIVTGFIPIKPGDVIRFKGAYILSDSTQSGFNTWTYMSDFTKQQSALHLTPAKVYDQNWSSRISVEVSDVGMDKEGVTKITLGDSIKNTDGEEPVYVRFTLERPTADTEPIITINEEIYEL